MANGSERLKTQLRPYNTDISKTPTSDSNKCLENFFDRMKKCNYHELHLRSGKLELSDYPFIKAVEYASGTRYHCDTCNSTLRSFYILKRHVLMIHTTSQCPMCDKIVTASKKEQHLRRVHNLEEVGFGKNKTLKERSPLVCDFCNKKYSTKRAMRYHLKFNHTYSKCPDCPSQFSKKELPLHRNDAHGTPIPTCGICGYRNAKEARVLIHQRQVHMNEKTVPCKLCDMKFFNKRYLTRHMIMHSPEKIHECSYCHKKFPRKNTLRMHEKIHKGEKNKVCAICGERFVQKASLNYHMGKHHPDAC